MRHRKAPLPEADELMFEELARMVSKRGEVTVSARRRETTTLACCGTRTGTKLPLLTREARR